MGIHLASSNNSQAAERDEEGDERVRSEVCEEGLAAQGRPSSVLLGALRGH